MCHRCTLQNRVSIAVKTNFCCIALISVQLISSASTNPHRTLLSRSPCVCACVNVCAYLALYKHLSHRPKNNTAITTATKEENAKLHCKVVAAVAVCCLRSLIASNCRLSAASTLLTYIHTNRLAHTHAHIQTYCTRLRKCPPLTSPPLSTLSLHVSFCLSLLAFLFVLYTALIECLSIGLWINFLCIN